MFSAKCGFTDGNALVHKGPTLNVQIGFDPLHLALPDGNLYIPKLPDAVLPALVDTGATESCIDSSLAKQLNLPVVDRRRVAGAITAEKVDVYLAQIYVVSLDHVIYGRFAGVNLKSSGQEHYALIGRTFLRHFSMTYNGKSGSVTISKPSP